MSELAEASAEFLAAKPVTAAKRITMSDAPRGFKQTEIGLIPQDWDISSLAEASEFLDGQRKPIKSADRLKMQGPYPYYGASGIIDHVNGYLFDEELILLGEDGENILSRSLPLAFKIVGKSWVNNHAHVLRPRSAINIDFLVEYLESIDYSDYNSGTAQPKLNKKSCAKIPIPLPPRAEQEAIAEALTDADEAVRAVERLIEKKRAVKQATLHALLTPTTRLPGFNSDWKKSTLGNLSRGKKEFFVDGDWIEAEYIRTSGIRFIQTGNIGVGCFVEKEDKKFIDEDSFRKLKCKSVKPGDLLICRLAEPAGRACVIPNLSEVNMVTSVDVAIFRPPSEVVNRKFLSQYFTRPDWLDEVRLKSGGTTHKRISRSALASIEILLPPLSEQTAIATILSDIDTEITALEAQRDKLKAIKQGMMQVLLTGKVRLL